MSRCQQILSDPTVSADTILRALAPECALAVYGRLRRERVQTAEDLAMLDKEDLTDLGLGMVDRSRVLAWARHVLGSGLDAFTFVRAGSGALDSAVCPDLLRTTSNDLLSANAFFEEIGPFTASMAHRQHLDHLEQQADYWCSLASSWTSPLVSRCRRAINCVSPRDVRESLLESLFDLSHERVKEVYDSMMLGADPDATFGVEQLRQGLAQYGLPDPNAAALQRLLGVVSGAQGGCIQLADFKTILSRLTLAQLVLLLEGEPRADALPTQGLLRARSPLFVVDYNARTFTEHQILDTQLRRFFFGSRRAPQIASDPPLVRWVHSKGFDLPLLLALMVKYNLHPLAVEDTLEQAPSKADRYGSHYFTTIEGLCLARRPVESLTVRVCGYHVAVFCTGTPTWDTVVSLAQPDASFAEAWPDDSPLISRAITAGGAGEASDAWASKIRQGLSLPLSRARERRAEYLVYKVVDACTDDIMEVIRAYISRLAYLECNLHAMQEAWPQNSMSEVLLARRQLYVISRRVRGLQRAVRKLMDDRDLGTGMSAYLQDIIEHIDEIMDECERLAGKCEAIAQAFLRAVERNRQRREMANLEQQRRQGLRRSRQADRQNEILFMLTIMTAIFAPIQFLAGVYGMNFVDHEGSPTMPELLWPQGYMCFWMVVVAYLLASSVCAACVFCYLRRRDRTGDDPGKDRKCEGRQDSCSEVPDDMESLFGTESA